MEKRMVKLDVGAIFYPRGGSAQLIRYLLPHLEEYGKLKSRLFVGSLGKVGDSSHAETFYRGIEVLQADYSLAVALHHSLGQDPMAARIPMHPSYEDRHDVPDRIFCSVAPAQADNLARFWTEHLRTFNAHDADVLHLFHLTPLHAAHATLRPNRPLVTTLCGTELKMMDGADRRMRLANRLGTSVSDLADKFQEVGENNQRLLESLVVPNDLTEDELVLLSSGCWEHWRHSEYWFHSMKRWAKSSTRLVVQSDHDKAEAQRLLEIDVSALVQLSPGVDIKHFAPLNLSVEGRVGYLREWLVKESKAALPNDEPGSLRYSEADLQRLHFSDGSMRPILLFVGRFLEFKRLPLLIRAFAKVRQISDANPVLVIWGGYPGEVEGEHPYDVAKGCGVLDDVYFIGWRDHNELKIGLNIADVMVAPAYNEPFGQVYLEAMACQKPVIASASGGPANFVYMSGPDANGWLVQPDDEAQLAETLAIVSADPIERRRRGRQGLSFVRREYSWAAMAVKYADMYADAISGCGEDPE